MTDPTTRDLEAADLMIKRAAALISDHHQLSGIARGWRGPACSAERPSTLARVEGRNSQSSKRR